MTANASAESTPASLQRRLVLVDFDWEDADLVPTLLQRPGISVRLVAGTRHDDAGVRLAEMCGLPRTIDLADLTREIFDLALVSERSPRRSQIEDLLLALGTPSVTPQSFLGGEERPAAIEPLDRPEIHAAALEDALGGDDFEEIVERTLSMEEQAPRRAKPATGRRLIEKLILEEFPSLEDRQGLEAALRELVMGTGAGHAELLVGVADALELVVQVGPSDPLLKGLIELAIELGEPQVMSSLSGQHEGKAWGAWPFRTAQRRGVLAAAAIDPGENWETWQRTVEELRVMWDHEDREKAGPAFPMVPELKTGWLEAVEFRMRLELAIERNRRDGMRFTLHRVEFPGSAEAVDRLTQRLPEQLRDTDCICRPAPRVVLLLTAAPRDTFPHLRRRMLKLWQEAWLEVGYERPIPGLKDERVELGAPADAEAFLAGAGAWLSGGGES